MPFNSDLVPRRYRRRRWGAAARQESVVKARYAAGMLLGCMWVGLTKKMIRAIPVVGRIAAPVLALLPTVILGPAIGAAVVYGLDEGDLTAARHKVKAAVKLAREEIDMVTRDVRDELHELQRRQQRAAQLLPRLQDQVADQVAQVERTLMPVLEQHYLSAKRQLESIQQELSKTGAPGAVLEAGTKGVGQLLLPLRAASKEQGGAAA